MTAQINVWNQVSTGLTVAGNSPNLSAFDADYLALLLDITALAGTAPTIQVFIEELDLAGAWAPVAQTAVLSAVGYTRLDIGPLTANAVTFGDTVRVRWVIGGSAGQTVTCTLQLNGRKSSRGPK